jgi:hypothetical protein
MKKNRRRSLSKPLSRIGQKINDDKKHVNTRLSWAPLVSAPAFGSAQAPQPPQQIILRFHSVRCFDGFSGRETQNRFLEVTLITESWIDHIVINASETIP